MKDITSSKLDYQRPLDGFCASIFLKIYDYILSRPFSVVAK